MVRPPCFDMNGIKSGVWSKEEDDALRAFVQKHGHHNWQKLPFLAGLKRSGKSCRLRWVNYLQPGLRKDNFSKEEEDLIIKLHNQHGNKWTTIAENFPGRTDNDIKNQWHAHIKKRGKRARAEMGVHDHEESFKMNCRKKSNYHQHETTNVEAQEFDAFELGYNVAPNFSHSFDVDLSPLIPEEEFSTFGLCYNDAPTFSGSSNGGITYGNHTCFDQINIDLPPPFSEEELSDFGLCHEGTPTFSDSSDGGITCHDDNTCFGQLNVDLPQFSEEEFNDLGLCYSDGTPIFSDSSDGSGITYDHDTCFSHLSNDLTPFPEEEFYDLWLCYNDTSNFSDSSSDGGITSLDSRLENHNEVFGLNNWERIWYFGDDV